MIAVYELAIICICGVIVETMATGNLETELLALFERLMKDKVIRKTDLQQVSQVSENTGGTECVPLTPLSAQVCPQKKSQYKLMIDLDDMKEKIKKSL